MITSFNIYILFFVVSAAIIIIGYSHEKKVIELEDKFFNWVKKLFKKKN